MPKFTKYNIEEIRQRQGLLTEHEQTLLKLMEAAKRHDRK